jgi:hypothetical protein
VQNRGATLALFREARRTAPEAVEEMTPYAVTDLVTGDSYIVTPVTLF